MEKRGIPTVALVNESFLAETKLVAKSRGLPSLRFVVFPYNIEVLPREEVRALAEKACREIVSLLVAGAAVKAQPAPGS